MGIRLAEAICGLPAGFSVGWTVCGLPAGVSVRLGLLPVNGGSRS